VHDRIVKKQLSRREEYIFLYLKEPLEISNNTAP